MNTLAKQILVTHKINQEITKTFNMEGLQTFFSVYGPVPQITIWNGNISVTIALYDSGAALISEEHTEDEKRIGEIAIGILQKNQNKLNNWLYGALWALGVIAIAALAFVVSYFTP